MPCIPSQTDAAARASIRTYQCQARRPTLAGGWPLAVPRGVRCAIYPQVDLVVDPRMKVWSAPGLIRPHAVTTRPSPEPTQQPWASYQHQGTRPAGQHDQLDQRRGARAPGAADSSGVWVARGLLDREALLQRLIARDQADHVIRRRRGVGRPRCCVRCADRSIALSRRVRVRRPR